MIRLIILRFSVQIFFLVFPALYCHQAATTQCTVIHAAQYLKCTVGVYYAQIFGGYKRAGVYIGEVYNALRTAAGDLYIERVVYVAHQCAHSVGRGKDAIGRGVGLR